MSICETDYIQKIRDYSQEPYVWAEEDMILREAVDGIIEEIKIEIYFLSVPLSEKINSLHAKLTSKIKEFLLQYEKRELMIALLGIIRV